MEFTLYCVNVQSKLWSTGRIGKILFRTFRDRVGERSIQIALDRNGNAKGPLAEGWYDVSLIDMMNEASETGKTEGEVALNHIQESLKGFSENKKVAVEFYYHKIVSQWNEPSFEALWISNHQPDQHPDGISKLQPLFIMEEQEKFFINGLM